MPGIETDYLVVGAGASGMAFADALAHHSDADVVLVDRRHHPGGHWLDAYPFVRLHQPSATYGVDSRRLGDDRIDTAGPNAGFYERATAAEICDYFGRVLDEDLVPTGRVRFLGMSDYRGVDSDGHHVVSLLTGADTTIRVRRKLVDATYTESSIPSRHTPGFVIDPDVRCVPPNDLVDLDEPAAGFTVIGAGKTAGDTCAWLLDAGVDPDAIEWIRPRDPWVFERAMTQPLELVGSYMTLQASWVAAAATAADAREFAHRLEADGVFVRIDPRVEPGLFRGATVSRSELDALRSIERVVRGRKVRRLTNSGIETSDGTLPGGDGRVYVDCTAAGLPPAPLRPVFERDRITLQYVTVGFVPWGAATIGVVEALRGDDAEKNRLCPPLTFTGSIDDVLHLAHAGLLGTLARAAERDIADWNETSRLNPAAGASKRLNDPDVVAGFTSLGQHIGEAVRNLTERAPLAPRA